MSTLADVTVPYSILRDPAPRMEGDLGGRRATFSVYLGLNDVNSFLTTAAGTTETITTSAGVAYERIVPLQHPDYKDLYLVSYSSEAFGTPGGTGTSVHTPQFSHARIDLEFQNLPFAIGGDTPFYSLTADGGVTVETIPGSVFVFPDSSRLSGEGGLTVPVVSFNLQVFMSAAPISYAVYAMVGKINSVAFDDFPIGTLRFDRVQSQFQRGMYSQSLVKSFAFSFRPRPWNQVMKANGVWDTPTLGGSGNNKYDSADLGLLKY